MQSRAETYRLKTQECEALAETMSDRDSREQLRITARQWSDLAEQVELLDRLDLV